MTTRAGEQCQRLGLSFDHFQTNHEGVMLDRIHQARADGTSFIVINAGAWTHTSVALVDALSGINVPFVEVHVRPRGRQGCQRDAARRRAHHRTARSPTRTSARTFAITRFSLPRPSVRGQRERRTS